jgi:hypothetical protein
MINQPPVLKSIFLIQNSLFPILFVSHHVSSISELNVCQQHQPLGAHTCEVAMVVAKISQLLLPRK